MIDPITVAFLLGLMIGVYDLRRCPVNGGDNGEEIQVARDQGVFRESNMEQRREYR
jgi:hypothetical protein